MIEMFEGVPGSGKSYHAVSIKLLAWVRAGRRIYAYIDGVHHDRLALFEGMDQEELEKQITIWMTADEVRAGLLQVEPGSAVIIDEVQTVFRAGGKTEPELLRWLETHRHRGIDIVMMCQQYGQVTLGVNRLVEATVKFRRLDRFGFKNRYQATVRGNPEETETIRMFAGKYDPKVYAYYSSYSSAARETVRGGSIMKSPTIIIGAAALVGAGWWFVFGGWLSGARTIQQEAYTASRAVPPPPGLAPEQAVAMASVPLQGRMAAPLRIQGGMTVFREGEVVWLWVAENGKLYTEEEIASETGGTVSSRIVRGVRVLSGTGVIYGGGPPTSQVPEQPIAPYVPLVNPNHGLGPPPMKSADPFATPAGILSTPAGL